MSVAPVALPRWTLVGALLVLFAFSIVGRLATPPPEYPHRTWLVEEPSPLTATPIPLDFVGFLEGADVFRLPLRSDEITTLLTHDEIGLVLGDSGTGAVFIDATLATGDGRCRFASGPASDFHVNAPLFLTRLAPCGSRESDDTLALEVRVVNRSGRIWLWTFEDAAQDPRLLWLHRGGHRLAVRGLKGIVYPPSSRSRAALVAYVWNITTPDVWLRVLLALIIMGLGLYALLLSDQPDASRSRILAAFGTGALVASLAMTSALIIPPLQVPDEADHLLTFGSVNERPALIARAEELARRTHFERIRHRPDQHFRAADIERPWSIAWSDTTHVEPIAIRSPLTAAWWHALDTVLPRQRVARALFALRLANVALLAVSVGIATWLLAFSLPERRSSLMGLGLLAIPTLPFFGMGLSDTAVATAVGIVLTAMTAAIALDGRRANYLGLPFGLAILLAVLCGRREWAVLPVIALVLLGRAIVGPVDNRVRSTLIFWSALLLPATMGFAWVATSDVVQPVAQVMTARTPKLATVIFSTVQSRFLLPLVLLPLPLIELIGIWLRRRRALPRGSRAVPVIGAVAAVLVLAPTLLSRFIDFPTSNGIHVETTGTVDYIASVLRSMLVPLRTGHFDLLLSTLFWGGFGWSDTVPQEWLLALVCAATAAVCGWTWWQIGQRGEWRGVILLVSLSVGLFVSLAASAAGAYGLRYDLYGRYLISWYLIFVTTMWLAPSATAKVPVWVWMVPVLLMHTYCLQLIATRYF